MELNEAIADAAIKGAAIAIIPGIKMCADCAFKKETDANNEEESVEKAADCLAYFGKFNCHTDALGDAGILCAGFLYAKQYFESIE